MARKISDRQRYLLEEVVYLYYIEHKNQQEIANKLFISRSQISRMLQEARDQGIVDIRIRFSTRRDYDMEDRIRSRFPLNDVRIMSARDESEIDERFARMGAEYFMANVRPKMIIGTTWGSSVSRVLEHVGYQAGTPIEVVQVMGSSMLDGPSADAQELVRSLAHKYNGIPHYIPAPLVVLNDEAHQALLKDAQVTKALELASFADMVLTGIGTFLDVMISHHSWLGYMTPDMLSELKQKRAIGSICAHFFDADGKIIDCRWNTHCVGITLEQVRKMENVVAIARGEAKADAILGALRGRFVNVLITDSSTAHRVLELSG